MDGYNRVHGGFGFGVRNKEDESVLKMGAALDIAVCNTWFKKRGSRLITYSFGAWITQTDYILAGTKTGSK